MRPATARVVGALFVTIQLAIPLTRLRPASPYPLSGRFAWTMFAGPLVGRCTHALTATRPDGAALPLPARGTALRAVLDARTPAEFSQAVWLFAPYADSDRDVARALDDLLRRWSRSLGAGATVVSELRCASPGWPPFSRTLRVSR